MNETHASTHSKYYIFVVKINSYSTKIHLNVLNDLYKVTNAQNIVINVFGVFK